MLSMSDELLSYIPFPIQIMTLRPPVHLACYWFVKILLLICVHGWIADYLVFKHTVKLFSLFVNRTP